MSTTTPVETTELPGCGRLEWITLVVTERVPHTFCGTSNSSPLPADRMQAFCFSHVCSTANKKPFMLSRQDAAFPMHIAASSRARTLPTPAPHPCPPLHFITVIQLPVTIDAAFVEYVRTQSLELHVWTGRREDWPAGGATCGVAKVVLSSLLTTIEGAGGDMAIVSERSGDGSDSGCITARVFFKHRGLGPNDDARPSRACGIEAVSRWGVASARGRPPVSFREEVEVLGQDRSGSGSPDDDDGFASGNEIIAPIMEDPALQDEPVNGRSSEQALEEEQASAAQNQSTGVADAAEQGVSSSSGLESVLEVYVERAMRLLAISGDRAVEADVAAPENSPPSTYVTFRWEEEGRSPLRSPLVPRGQARSTAVGGDTEEWQVCYLRWVLVSTGMISGKRCMFGGICCLVNHFRGTCACFDAGAVLFDLLRWRPTVYVAMFSLSDDAFSPLKLCPGGPYLFCSAKQMTGVINHFSPVAFTAGVRPHFSLHIRPCPPSIE